MEETINKISDTVAEIISPIEDSRVETSIDQLDQEIRICDQDIDHLNEQLVKQQNKKSLYQNRRNTLVEKGVISEVEKQRIMAEQLEIQRIEELSIISDTPEPHE